MVKRNSRQGNDTVRNGYWHSKFLRTFTVVLCALIIAGLAGVAGWYISTTQYTAMLSSSDNRHQKTLSDLTLQLNQVGEHEVEVQTQLKQLKQEYEHHATVSMSIPPITNGLAPVISRISTTEPVVFLGIDDGSYKDQKVIDLLKANNIKATLFLSDLFIHNNPDFFKQIIAQGSLIENHTLSHDTKMSTKSFEYQTAEICGMSTTIEHDYGRKPYLFRPPGGAYTATTQQAAASCGMRAIVNWIAKANGGSMQYQIGHELRPGDIVLMHFRPEFADDLAAFVKARDAAGLHTELLEDWIKS
ncbi:MAG: polysaccharide deacetylase family protein [Candidatus Saccharimonadales bacterium]